MEEEKKQEMNGFTCSMCKGDVFGSPVYSVDDRHLCYLCAQRVVDGLNNREQQQETLYAHCKECGKGFNKIVTPYPSKDSEYCYMCYWRMLARGNERQDRYACHECNQTFFTAEPNWFEGKRYCYECFCNIKVKRESFESEQARRIFEEMLRNRTYRTFSWDFAHEGDASGRSYYYRTNTSSNASTSSISSAVQEAFKVLGLVPGATAQDIKKAFKQKALVTHPDLGGQHTDMVALNKAKEIALEYAGS